MVSDTNGKLLRMCRTSPDITENESAKQALEAKEKELESLVRNFEEAYSATRVLLEQKDKDKKEFEERIIYSVKEGIYPVIEKIKRTSLNDLQLSYIEIIKLFLDDIVTTFTNRLPSRYANLTPAEIEVAGLIRGGKKTKEIANLLNLSAKTIGFHRNNLRKKLGLRNKKVNLRSYLVGIGDNPIGGSQVLHPQLPKNPFITKL